MDTLKEIKNGAMNIANLVQQNNNISNIIILDENKHDDIYCKSEYITYNMWIDCIRPNKDRGYLIQYIP